MEATATTPMTLESKLRARLPDHAHIFSGSAPPEHARPHLGFTMLPRRTSYVGANGELVQLPERVCAEWTTPDGFWQVWAEEVRDQPGRWNIRLDGPPGDWRLDAVSESHLMALLELSGFIPSDMMADLIGLPA